MCHINWLVEHCQFRAVLKRSKNFCPSAVWLPFRPTDRPTINNFSWHCPCLTSDIRPGANTKDSIQFNSNFIPFYVYSHKGYTYKHVILNLILKNHYMYPIIIIKVTILKIVENKLLLLLLLQLICFFEMAAMPFPCNGLLLCWAIIP